MTQAFSEHINQATRHCPCQFKGEKTTDITIFITVIYITLKKKDRGLMKGFFKKKGILRTRNQIVTSALVIYTCTHLA